MMRWISMIEDDIKITLFRLWYLANSWRKCILPGENTAKEIKKHKKDSYHMAKNWSNYLVANFLFFFDLTV